MGKARFRSGKQLDFPLRIADKLREKLSLTAIRRKVDSMFEYAEPNLPMIGLFGSVGYPLFYVVWKYIFPQPYENLSLRLVEALIALPWLLVRILPKKIKNYIPIYFILTAPVLMPFFFHFMLLKNGWSVVWMMSSMASLVLLILIIKDWRFVCGYTVFGYLAAYLAVRMTDGAISYDSFTWEYVPIYLFLLVGGLIGNHQHLIAQQSKISLMRSLSGSIAHEMRNPLNSITNAMGIVQTVLPEKPENGDEQQQFVLSAASVLRIHEVIDEGLATIKRGNKIIDSILATLQDGAMDTKNFKRVSTGSVIHSAIVNYGYSDMQELGLVVDNARENFDFLGDKDLLIYVLFNLLSNALHYKAKPGFRIDISSECRADENYIRVRDTGPGVPASKRELIFERFYTSGKRGGNGLGLAFCRRVVESFGGTIKCESEEGLWTEFIIRLPLYDSWTVNDIKRQILRNRHILVVDDQASNRLLLTKFLTDLNCPVDYAEDGQQALERLSRNYYDLVFMDFEMPVLNGDRAVGMLRQMQDIEPSLAQHNEQIPVIGITALTPEDALPRAAACGMNEVLHKPLKRQDIHNVIERYFFSQRPSISGSHEEILSRSRILLVDDNETSRKFMSMILEHYGCSIGQAENGAVAIEMLERNDYDLVVMDMLMPVMNGVEATRAIRAGAGFSRFKMYRELPILALTGYSDAQTIADIQRAGMNHFLCKPIIKDELVSTIAFWLQNRSAARNAGIAATAPEAVPPAQDPWQSIVAENILDRSIINSIRSFSSDEDFAALLDIFFKDASGFLDELSQAESRRDIRRFEHLTHTLKGSSGSMGANRLFVMARYLNALAHRGEWPDHQDWHAIMAATYAETVREMMAMLNTRVVS